MVDCVGASTLVMGCSTEVVEEHTYGIIGSQAEGDMGGFKAKYKV